MAFSVIVPTVGRSTLVDTLESLVGAGLEGDDEVVLVVDGRENTTDALAALGESLLDALVAVRVVTIAEQAGDWGHPARNLGVRTAVNEWLLFTQDDNVLAEGSLARVRRDVRGYPGGAHLYRVVPAAGLLVPQWEPPDPGVRAMKLGRKLPVGHVDGDCLVVSRAYAGQWGEGYNGDYDWLDSTLAKHPDGWAGVIYHPRTLLSYHGRLGPGYRLPGDDLVPAQDGGDE